MENAKYCIGAININLYLVNALHRGNPTFANRAKGTKREQQLLCITNQ